MTKPIKITREELLALDPCDHTRRLALFGRRKSISASQALAAGASIDDILWVAGRLGRKDLIVRFALACAQRVAHHNPDPRVQAALDAVQAWLDNPTETGAAAAAAARSEARSATAAARSAEAWSARSAAEAAWSAAEAAWSARSATAARSAAEAAAEAAAARSAAWSEQTAQRQLIKEIFG